MIVMKNTALMIGALMLVSCGPLMAQNSQSAAGGRTLTVKSGQKITFVGKGLMDMTVSAQGKEMKTAMTSDSDLDLIAKKVAKGKIDWIYSMTRFRMHMRNEMTGRDVDSTIKMKLWKFTTDMTGNVLSSQAASQALDGIFGGTSQANIMAQMFSPTLTRTLVPGQTWEENKTDTAALPKFDGAIIIRRTTKYTYEGPVDTLATRALRVRAEVTSMTIEGTVSLQGLDMTAQGDGTSMSTIYYSADDQVMLVTKMDNQMNMNMALSGGMEMVIPMVQKGTTTMVRKGL